LPKNKEKIKKIVKRSPAIAGLFAINLFF